MEHRRWRARAAGLALVAASAVVPIVTEAPASAATAPDLTVVILGGLGSTAADYQGAGSISNYLSTRAGTQYQVKVFGLPSKGYTTDTSGVVEKVDTLTKKFKEWMAVEVKTSSVVLVAHSAGGLVARNYVKTVDKGARVKKVLLNGVANYGTVFLSQGNDYEVGSTFLAGLNAGDVSVGSVRYWPIITVYDEIVWPYENQVMPRTGGTRSTSVSFPYVKPNPFPGLGAPDPQITNVILQESCPTLYVPHIGMTKANAVQTVVGQILDDKPISVPC